MTIRFTRVQPWLPWLCILFVALMAQGWVMRQNLHEFESDPDAYRTLAEGWAKSGTFGHIDSEGIPHPTAYRPFLYPWLLSWMVDSRYQLNLHYVACFHSLLSVSICLLGADTARRLSSIKGVRPNLQRGLTSLLPLWMLVGLGLAIDPIMLHQSTQIMTEPLATFLATITWWLWILLTNHETSESDNRQWSPLGAGVIGILLAVNIWCRPTGIVWAILIAMTASLLLRAKGVRPLLKKRSLTPLAYPFIWLLIVAACLMPWALRNQRVLGRMVWLTTHGGYTYLLANNPLLYRHLQLNGPSRDWDAREFHARWRSRGNGDPAAEDFWVDDKTAGTANVVAKDFIASSEIVTGVSSELEQDEIANRAAWATIRRHPAMFVGSMFTRVGWLWAWWPAVGNGSTAARMAIGAYYALISAMAGFAIAHGWVRIWRGKWNRAAALLWLPGLAMIASLTLVHAFYWSNMRMRAPAMPALYMIAILGNASYLSSWFSFLKPTNNVRSLDENKWEHLNGDTTTE